jgi:hypothetical protein
MGFRSETLLTHGNAHYRALALCMCDLPCRVPYCAILYSIHMFLSCRARERLSENARPRVLSAANQAEVCPRTSAEIGENVAVPGWERGRGEGR